MNPKHRKLAEEQFEAYPDLQVVHISTDDQVFHHSNHHDGVNHQRRLDETQKLVMVSRKSLAQDDEDDDNDFGFEEELKLELELREKRAKEQAEEQECLRLEEEGRLRISPAPVVTPDENWKNADIVEWLKVKGVDEKANQKKELLLERVAEVLKADQDANNTGGSGSAQ